MKTIIITAAAALFAANIGAAEIYHGLAEGNSDLSTPRVSAEDFVGVQPSIGDSLDRLVLPHHSSMKEFIQAQQLLPRTLVFRPIHYRHLRPPCPR